jgi:hypothetical protein
MSYEEALSNYAGGKPSGPPGEMEVAFEVWTARPDKFGSRAEAVSAMSMARTQVMSSQPGHFLPPQLQHARRDWSDPNASGSPALARAVATTPVGGVSGVVEDHLGFHLVRVIARRPRIQASPAAAPVIQPVSYQTPIAPASAQTMAPRIVALQQADCNCK